MDKYKQTGGWSQARILYADAKAELKTMQKYLIKAIKVLRIKGFR
jgi:hypothetical protein